MKSKIGVISSPTKWILVQQNKIKYKKEIFMEQLIHVFTFASQFDKPVLSCVAISLVVQIPFGQLSHQLIKFSCGWS